LGDNDQVKENEMGRALSTNGGKINAYWIFVGKTEGKTLVGRPRRRWVDNIQMDLREMGWGGMGWIDLAQDMDQWRAVVYTVMNLRVPYIAGNFFSSCRTGGFSRRAQFQEVSCNSGDNIELEGPDDITVNLAFFDPDILVYR
jgi:hypothetical protein